MYTTISLLIIGEVILTALTVWGFMHEQKFIEFEDRVIAVIKHKIRVQAKRRNAEKMRKLNERVAYSPVAPSKKRNSSSRAA